MKSIRRAIATLALIVCTPVMAAPPSVEAVTAAGNKLIARLDTLKATDQPPMLSNADGELIRTAFSVDGARNFPLDPVKVGPACIAIGGAMVAFANYADRVSAAAPDPRAAGDALFGRLQSEVAMGLSSGLLCAKRGFRAIHAMAGTLAPERRVATAQGVDMMRGGYSQAVTGALEAIVLGGMNASNQAMVMSAIAEDGQFIAESYSSAERAKLRDRLAASRPKLSPAMAKQLDVVLGGFASRTCNTLCTIGTR